MPQVDTQKAEEMKRMAAEKQTGFILAKARVGSSSQPVPFHESQEFGIHFSESVSLHDLFVCYCHLVTHLSCLTGQSW